MVAVVVGMAGSMIVIVMIMVVVIMVMMIGLVIVIVRHGVFSHQGRGGSIVAAVNTTF